MSKGDDSFQGLAAKYHGAYKKWIQGDFVSRLPKSFEGGACFALSMIYVARNYLAERPVDTIPEINKTAFLQNDGVLYTVANYIYESLAISGLNVMSGQGQATAEMERIAAQGVLPPLFPVKVKGFRSIAESGVGLKLGQSLQEAETKRQPPEDFEPDVVMGAYNKFNKKQLRRLVGDSIKPYKSPIQCDLSDVGTDKEADQELDAIVKRLGQAGYHILDVPEHTQAVVVKGNKYKYFDPNEGMAVFNNAKELGDFVEDYLMANYPGELVSVYSYR